MTIDLTAYDALSFDCYGTLIDWEAGIAAVLGPWARRHDPAFTDEQVLAAYSGNEAEVEAESPSTLYPDVLREAFRRTGSALGFEVTDADADALGTSVPDWPAFPDSAGALARLKSRYALIILSNVDRESFAGSNRRLQVEFDEILTAQDIGSYKPNPANFAALQARVAERGSTGRLLHVAQSLFHDHVPAQAAGLPSVWIDRRHDKAGWGATPDPGVSVTPDLRFPSLAVFADAVDAAFAGQSTA
jgi:2-haloalkanoic acid dehalogenase type II